MGKLGQLKYIVIIYIFYLPWEWCHDDAETSAFNVNICLFMLKEIVIDQCMY